MFGLDFHGLTMLAVQNKTGGLQPKRQGVQGAPGNRETGDLFKTELSLLQGRENKRKRIYKNLKHKEQSFKTPPGHLGTPGDMSTQWPVNILKHRLQHEGDTKYSPGQRPCT